MPTLLPERAMPTLPPERVMPTLPPERAMPTLPPERVMPTLPPERAMPTVSPTPPGARGPTQATEPDAVGERTHTDRRVQFCHFKFPEAGCLPLLRCH